MRVRLSFQVRVALRKHDCGAGPAAGRGAAQGLAGLALTLAGALSGCRAEAAPDLQPALRFLQETPAQAVPSPEEEPAVPIGAEIAPFRFMDAHFLPRSLGELGQPKAFVITFTTNDCPIARRYLPKLGDLERRFRDRGVQFLLLNVGPDDSLVDAIGLALDAGIDYPVGRDLEGRAVAALGVSRTPETVVLDADLHLRYRGRVDDQYRFGGARRAKSRGDLERALEQVLAGEVVSLAETQVDGCLIAPSGAAPTREVNFAEVQPILAQRCLACHGEPLKAPFPLVTYDDVSAHAEMIAEVVEQRRMPPWFADARFGVWHGDARLSSDEVRTVLDWVQGGAPRGDAADAPIEKRAIPADAVPAKQPGLTLYAGRYELPADGVVPYAYVTLTDASGKPYEFPEDTWIVKTAVVPSNPQVLHHARVQLESIDGAPRMVGGYAPGTDGLEFDDGVALKIPKGSKLVTVLHHVTTGLPVTSEVKLELYFPDGRVTKQARNMSLGTSEFAIPPGDRNFGLTTQKRMPRQARGVALFSHMHLRGRDMRFEYFADPTAKAPAETLLLISSWSFDWQLVYYWDPAHAPIFEPGSVIQCTAHYDNSAFNAYNPDSTRTVTNGEQTEDEMMVAVLLFVDEEEQLDIEVDPATGWQVSAPDAAGAAGAGSDGGSGR